MNAALFLHNNLHVYKLVVVVAGEVIIVVVVMLFFYMSSYSIVMSSMYVDCVSNTQSLGVGFRSTLRIVLRCKYTDNDDKEADGK